MRRLLGVWNLKFLRPVLVLSVVRVFLKVRFMFENRAAETWSLKQKVEVHMETLDMTPAL